MLVVSGLPAYYIWNTFLLWFLKLAIFADRTGVKEIRRTVENGNQYFWISMNTPESASDVRGIISNRSAGDAPSLRCDFVDGNTYSSMASRSTDSWNPASGFANPGADIINRWPRSTLIERLTDVIIAEDSAVMPRLTRLLNTAPNRKRTRRR